MTQPPANVVPVCYRHPDKETYVQCIRCDRPICPNCMNEASVGFQCPECVRQGARSQRPVRTAFGGGTSGAQGTVTTALIIVNVLVFIATIISSGKASAVAGGGMGGLLGGFTPLHEWGALVTYPIGILESDNGERTRVLIPGGMHDGEYYRLLTSMFLHYGILHLGLNMWALWQLGRPLEALLGRVRFLALYLVSGLGGGVAVYVFASPISATAGASGAVFGLFAALFVVLRKLKRSVASIVPALVINLIFTFSVPGISIAGHLGGMAAGALVTLGLAYAPQKQRNLIQASTVVGMLVVFGVLFAVRTATLVPPAGIPFFGQ